MFFQRSKDAKRPLTRREFDAQRHLADGAGQPEPEEAANPDHFAKLLEGVEAWNKWREENPDTFPDLRGIDLTDPALHHHPLFSEEGVANLAHANLSDASFDNTNLSGVYLAEANLFESSLWQANLSGANLNGANLSGAFLPYANLSGAHLVRAKLLGVTLWDANLSGARLQLANLSGAELLDANLSGADLSAANLSGADLSECKMTDCDVTHVKYDRARLKNRCHGVRAESCYGHAQFKRDIQDQDYIDQTRSMIFPFAFSVSHLLDGFKFTSVISGLLVGVLLWVMTHNYIPSFGGGAGAFAWVIVGAVLLFSVLNSTVGRMFLFWLWGLLDYGRDWDRVAILAFFLILIFGGSYQYLGAAHIEYLRDSPEDIWFYPWFVAMMGFATLGVSDLAEPVTGLGALVMMGNVLSGFVTLGLLLAVLANTFARRAN